MTTRLGAITEALERFMLECPCASVDGMPCARCRAASLALNMPRVDVGPTISVTAGDAAEMRDLLLMMDKIGGFSLSTQARARRAASWLTDRLPEESTSGLAQVDK